MRLSRKMSTAIVARSSMSTQNPVETTEAAPLEGVPMSLDAAIVWERKSSGYRIVDLRLDRFMQALRFVLVHYCSKVGDRVGKHGPLAASSRSLSFMAPRGDPSVEGVGEGTVIVEILGDPQGARSRLYCKMHEMFSFCALQDGSEEIVGVLIASHLDRNQTELKFKSSQGDALHQIAELKYYAITEAEFYEMVNAEKLIHIDVLCVDPAKQKEGIGTALVRSCVSRAAKLNSGCVGEFSCDAAQTIAERLGFEIYSEIPYKYMGWLHRKFEIFETCQTKDYSLVCTALVPPVPRIPSVIIPPSMVVKASTKKKEKGKTNSKKKKVKKR